MLSRLLATSPVVLATSLVAAACSAPPAPAEGDPGDDTSAEALRTVAASGTCNRAKVMASVTGARRTVLSRGFKWLDAQVPYSQSRTHEGYRTDCSGFVSMCWQTGTSYTTAIYSSGGGNASTIGAFSNLLPGDALVKRGHMMLFTGWADSAKTGICALEQASTASDMQFRVRAVSSLRGEGYKAIRSNKIGAGAAPSEEEPTTEPTEPSEEEPTTEPPEESELPPEEMQPAPAPSGSSGGGAATPPPVEEPPAEEPPVADDTENPQPSQLETEPSQATRTSEKTTKKKASAAEEEEDDDASGPTAVARQGSACTVARAGAPARGPGVGLGLGLAALAVLRRRRA